jgi:hypothetical protein
VTWDQWSGPEVPANCGGITNYKLLGIHIDNHSYWTTMNNMGPARDYNAANGTHIAQFNTDECNSPANVLAPGILRDERVQSTTTGKTDGAGQTNKAGLPGALTRRQYPVYTDAVAQYVGRWTRYWIEVRPMQPYDTAFTEWEAFTGLSMTDSTAGWWMWSKWQMDELDSAPKRILYKVPINANAASWVTQHISRIRFTADSSKTGFIGPWVMYFRNFVVLKNYTLPSTPETDSFIFQAPEP